VKNFILRWLGIEKLYLKYGEVCRRCDVQEKEIRQLKSLIQVGVDFSPKGNDSWAVLCLAGNKDYVAFFNLQNKDVRDISMFLRQYEKQNVLIDLPYGMPKDFFIRT
jgi:hypothetical protein